MTYAIAGNVDAGGTNLAQRLSKLFPDHTFTRLVYEAGEEKDEALSACDGVLIAVSLLEGPMPGTRAAVSDCRRVGKDIIGFALTHEDDFDHQKKVPAHFKELVEIDARELASVYGFTDDNIPACRLALVPGCDDELSAFFKRAEKYGTEIGG